jgi:heptosyltransferase I
VPESGARRIGLIRTGALGDVVHALPLVNGLRDAWPDAHLTWIVHPVPHEVVRHQRAVDRFIVFERHGGLAAWRRLAHELRAAPFDLLLVPQVSAKAGMIAALARAEVKLGFDFRRSRELHWFVTNRHLPHRPPQHVQDHYLEFLAALGITGTPVRWDIVFTPEELTWRERFVASVGRPAVAFVVASAHPEKDWSPVGYAEVMARCERELGVASVIVGGPSRREREVAGEIVAACPVRPVVALEKPVRHTLLQLSAAAAVVAPDTGPLHAAVALGTPTVGLYGTTNPRRCGPYRAYGDLLVDRFSEPGERDALRRTKPGRMARITADEVFDKVRLALERYPRGDAAAAGRRGDR